MPFCKSLEKFDNVWQGLEKFVKGCEKVEELSSLEVEEKAPLLNS
jgi:hypothetical protein